MFGLKVIYHDEFVDVDRLTRACWDMDEADEHLHMSV
jgi:hypothetical protein